VNERIRIPQIRVIGAEGEQLGILYTEEALQMAKDNGLDLVEVAPEARPPVCKIMDYGKYKYEIKQKKKQSAKKQHKVVTKEVRIRPKTGEHDFMVKLKRARQFLAKDYKVQVNVLFRGRERAHGDIAKGQRTATSPRATSSGCSRSSRTSRRSSSRPSSRATG
jgi:translation initiation factor IF-3